MNNTPVAAAPISEQEYNRRIRAWTMYDWANSAFSTTVMAVVLPVYFSQVAGATLPNAATATSIWSLGLSFTLLLAGILGPILGTIADIKRSKKQFLAAFAAVGILCTALLVFVDTGEWALALILAVFGGIGFSGANVFYDSLLPHVAREDDQDSVSTRGFAMGYLGGGLLLAINIAMILLIPGTWGSRLSFLSVAVWWAVFSIPIFRRVPEPPAATMKLAAGKNVLTASLHRLRDTLADLRQYRQLFKYLISYLLYKDGIGTIIGVAAIYGTELGFGRVELILALLLVQFVGIPFSLIFGRLPSVKDRRRPFYLAFVIFNLVALPLCGILGAQLLPAAITGAQPASGTNNLLAIIGLIIVIELVGLGFAFLLGGPLFTGLAKRLDTKHSILLSLVFYGVIAVWGFFLNSVIEFWFLAWMVAVVQGGSQALSRSLYASMSPSVKSGQFFGFFGVMEKMAAMIGPLLFAAAGLYFGSSRPAVLSLIALFLIGGALLSRVDVDEGRRVAQEENRRALSEIA